MSKASRRAHAREMVEILGYREARATAQANAEKETDGDFWVEVLLAVIDLERETELGSSRSTMRPVVVSYGGGLDSFCMIVEGVRRKERIDVVAFVDVGDPSGKDPGEWPGTYQHLREVVMPFCAKHGIVFVWITGDDYPVRDAKSLYGWMRDRKQIPVAGPNRICTIVAKVERFEAWLDDAYPGQEVDVWIGFEAGEESRAAKDPNAGRKRKLGPRSALRHNRFPLMEWGLCRCRCVAAVRKAGMPVPRKSACVFCPYGSKGDWQTLQRERPDLFKKAAELESRKPPTKSGRKLSIMAYRTVYDPRDMHLPPRERRVLEVKAPPLHEYVKGEYKRKHASCSVCGAKERATKATGCDYLPEDEGRRPNPARARARSRDLDTALELWGSDHEHSQEITGSSAQMLGVDGYRRSTSAQATEAARTLLDAIMVARPGKATLYSGHHLDPKRLAAFEVGKTVRLPLTATTNQREMALRFADGSRAGSVDTLLRFRGGTRAVPNDGGEWITAGDFAVQKVTSGKHPFWKSKLVTIDLVQAPEGAASSKTSSPKETRAELERLPTEVLDQRAFGFKNHSIIELRPSQITIWMEGDLENATHDYERGQLKDEYRQPTRRVTPQRWAETVYRETRDEPVDVRLRKGRYELMDGHHRYVAAKALGDRPLKAIVHIEDNPINVILGEGA